MNIKNYFIFLLISIFSYNSFACHETTLTETSVTDNGDGTYEYELEICMGSENTYGFELTFNGANLISANTSCITSATTGETICASIPSVSGSGDVEYGDFDNSTGGDPFHAIGDGQQCFILSFTLDGPAADAELFGTEESVGFCSENENLTSCFGQLTVDGTVTDASDPCSSDGEITVSADNGFEPYSYSWDNGQTGATISNLSIGTYTVTVTDDQGCTLSESYTVEAPSDPDYTVELTTPSCIGGDVTWEIEDPDGAIIGSGSLAQNGLSETFLVCGCGSQLNLTVPAGTTGQAASRCTNDMSPDGQIEVFDIDGNSLGSATQDGATIFLDCNPLPITLGSFEVSLSEVNQLNNIEWITISETNNDYFILEYSTDGDVWIEIERIDGAGNSTSENSYQASHRSINNGIDYYRLKQVDTDGKINEKGIRSLDNNNDDRELVKKLNMIGQEVKDNYEGVVIEYYNDGTTIKRYQ